MIQHRARDNWNLFNPSIGQIPPLLLASIERAHTLAAILLARTTRLHCTRHERDSRNPLLCNLFGTGLASFRAHCALVNLSSRHVHNYATHEEARRLFLFFSLRPYGIYIYVNNIAYRLVTNKFPSCQVSFLVYPLLRIVVVYTGT